MLMKVGTPAAHVEFDLDASHFQAVVAGQSDLISLARPDGMLVYVNEAYARNFGSTVADLIGRSLYDFVERHDQARVRGVLEAVLLSGTASRSENRMRSADGSEHWVVWTNNVHTDRNGNTLLHSVGRDVTERRQIAGSLEASEAFLERIGKVAGVGGWEVDVATSRLRWSEQTRRLHEVDSNFVPTLDRAIAFYAEASRPAIESAVRRGMATGEPWDLELPLVTALGRNIWVRAVGEVEFENGTPVRLVGALQDITERHRLQEQLAENARFLRRLADGLPIEVAYVGADRRYRFANEEFSRRLGRSLGDVVGKTRAELMSDVDHAAYAERERAVLGGAPQQFEVEHLSQTESRRFEHRLIPDRSDTGAVAGFFVASIDITRRSAAQRALAELTAIFDNTTDFVTQTDSAGRIVYMNAAARRAAGMGATDELAGLHVGQFTPYSTRRLLAGAILPAVRSGAIWIGDTTIRLPRGGELPINHMVIAHRNESGEVERYSSVMRDISDATRDKREVRRQMDILRSVTEAIPATVVIVGTDGRYRFVNSAFERYCDLPREQILGRKVAEVLPADEIDRRRPWMQRAFAGEPVTFTLDYPQADSTTYLSLTCIPLRTQQGQVEGFVGIGQDVTDQKTKEARLTHLSQRDPLTGLLNRSGFDQGLKLLSDKRGGVAVLYIDLDDFKPVNDRHGHPTGDLLLQMFSQRLTALVRPSDVVARFGGDEFAIAMGGVPAIAIAEAVADKVLQAASTVYEVGPVSLSVHATVGLAYSDEPDPDWQSLLAAADERLLQAKAAGKGRRS
ncbi:hypothetical protein BH11PSE8_BH11PSE8_42050 [soil metagenome]